MARDPEGDRNITGAAVVEGGLQVKDPHPNYSAAEAVLEVVGAKLEEGEEQQVPYFRVRTDSGADVFLVNLDSLVYVVSETSISNRLNVVRADAGVVAHIRADNGAQWQNVFEVYHQGIELFSVRPAGIGGTLVDPSGGFATLAERLAKFERVKNLYQWEHYGC